MQIISSIFYFVIVLGILVFVHEFGHFIMARLSGMRVDVFALGMGFRLFGWNKITGFTFGNLPKDMELNGNTDYRISALPIGGYCKIAGMVDESFDSNFEAQEPQPYEFRSKNPFKKSITIAGGVLFNLLLAITFFSIISYKNGETVINTTTIGSVADKSIGQTIGLKPNDKIISINGKSLSSWNDIVLEFVDKLGNDKQIKLQRNGLETVVQANGKQLVDMFSAKTPLGIEPNSVRTVILAVTENSLAKNAGLQNNDTVIAINQIPIHAISDFMDILQANKNKEITLAWKHSHDTIIKKISLDESGKIGVQISQIFAGDITRKDYSIFGAIAEGAKTTFDNIGMIVSSIKQIVAGKLEFKKAIGGPVMIAQQASQFAEHGFYSFIYFTAMLSISLALINILPLPALDGGHIVIIIIEAIISREIPIKIKLGIQQVGMFLLIGLMLYVIINDVLRLV